MPPGAPAWLADVVTAVAQRAGGSTYRAGDVLTAVVAARRQGEFDVALDVGPESATITVWGLERRHDFTDARAGGDAAALALLDDWLALLDGSSGLSVYYRGDVARCWSVTSRAAVSPWHPRPPERWLVRSVQRWRRASLTNAFLDAEATQASRAEARSAIRAAHAARAGGTEPQAAVA